MTTTTPASPYGATLDLSGTPRVGLATLVKVEMRKMVDTRSGLWLLIAIGVITLLITVIFSFAADAEERTFASYMGVMATPQGFLLPVLGILLVTQEWTQRTGMVTFTLEPHRGKVIWAKVVAALVYGLAAVALAVLLAALGGMLGGSSDPWGGLGVDDVAKFTMLQVIAVVQGLAFGLIFLNSAAAIVVYFVVPIAFSVVSSITGAIADIQPWIDLGTAQIPLFEGGNLTGEQWAQIGVSSLIWVALPFVLGMWRVLRAELK
jgi:ABC-2 type transport system permease protein